MKKTVKVTMLAAVMVMGCAAFAGPHGGRHHRHHRDGLDLATGIVNLVMSVVAPAPVVVAPAPVVVTPPPVYYHRRPVVVTPPPRHHYRPAPRYHACG